jgi:hypothetical protein
MFNNVIHLIIVVLGGNGVNGALFSVTTTNSSYWKTTRKCMKRTKRQSQKNKETKQWGVKQIKRAKKGG